MPGPNKLLPIDIKFIEYVIDHPEDSYAEIGKAFGKTHNWVYKKWHKPCVTEAIYKRAKEEFKGYSLKAQKKMLELMESSKDEVALNAAKFILQSAGYNDSEVKITAAVDLIKVQIMDGEQEMNEE